MRFIFPALAILFFLAAVLAWLLPGAKSPAVFGRLSYTQFVLAVLLSVISIGLLGLVACPRARRREIGFRLSAVLLAMFSTVALWEAGSRLLPGDALTHNPWYVWAPGGTSVSDDLRFERPPHLRWEGLSSGDIGERRGTRYATPVTFNTDYEGFRNEEDIRQAEIVFIGDSYTEAGNVPVTETFSQRVRRALDVSVRNLGRAHHAPSQELIILRKYGLKMNPRAVVWQFCETNDLMDEWSFQWWIDQGRPRQDFARHPQAALWEHRSPTFRLFEAARGWSEFEQWPLSATFQAADGHVHPMRFSYLPNSEQTPGRNPGWPWIAATLREGATLLERANIDLIVLAMPLKIRVIGPYVSPSPQMRKELEKHALDEKVESSGWFARAAEGTALPWDIAPGRTFARQLENICEELGVPFVDSMPALRALAADGKMVYFPYETHISSLGHQAVAEALLSHSSGVLRNAV
ncbi:MAG: hypothetical protein ACC661_02745, partial [Verrucomicrobiales bacterium]